MALQDGYLPATIHYQVPDPPATWTWCQVRAGRPMSRYAMSNSLGFGGHNGSLLFKKWEA